MNTLETLLGSLIIGSLIGGSFGLFVGVDAGEEAVRRQAIEVGVAKYNEKTAKFEWILPENNN